MRKKDNNLGYWAQVATSDGLRLDGFLHPENLETGGRHVALLMHGAGANFYGASLVNRVGSHLQKAGWSVLRANNRGHDGWHVAFRSGKMVYLGSAFERLEESVLDVAAWILWLKRSGYQTITLVGHSLGAFKSLYALSQFADSDTLRECWQLVDRVVAISPPCLSQDAFQDSDHGSIYRETVQRCQQMLQDDQGSSTFWATYPFPMLLSPGCYLNKYASGSRFDFLQWLDQIGKPVYWMFGGQELETHQVLNDAVSRLRNRLPAGHQLEIVPGADHFFTGYTNQVGSTATQWLNS